MSVLCVCKCKMTFYLNHQWSVEKAVVFCSVLFAMTWQEILFTKIFFIHLLSRPNYGLYCKLFGKTDEWMELTYAYIHVCMYVNMCVCLCMLTLSMFWNVMAAAIQWQIFKKRNLSNRQENKSKHQVLSVGWGVY